jgi:hypothetical protein|tara:strand:+ start:356 stop:676 length:321 start_codon:yes stop_codon:yes gene_type:complete
MIKVLVTIILVSAFFILFFNPTFDLKNKTEPEVSTTAGFIEDTYRGPFINHFIPPKYGDIGTFTAYSSIPDDHWLHGFPHESGKIKIPIETDEEKLKRRLEEIKNT